MWRTTMIVLVERLPGAMLRGLDLDSGVAIVGACRLDRQHRRDDEDEKRRQDRADSAGHGSARRLSIVGRSRTI